MPRLSDWGKKVAKKGGGDGGKYIKNKAWKEDGKLLFWLHPESMLEDRELLILPVALTNDDDEKSIYWVRRHYDGADGIAAQFLTWLEEQEELDADDVILKIRHGKDRQTFKKGELLGMKGFGFKGKILTPRTESVMCVIPHEDPGVRLLALPISAGKKVWNLIKSQMDDLGADDGNPQVSPYALKVTYDKGATRGSDMYDAFTSGVKLSDEITECFEEKVHDVEAECSQNGQDLSDFGTTSEILRALCVIDCPLWDTEEVESEEPEGDEEMPEDFGAQKKTKAKRNPKSKPAPKPELEPEPEEEDGDEDGEDDEIQPIDAKDAEEGIVYSLEDDTEITFEGIARKRAVFVDEDGKKHRLALDAFVWPVEADDDEEEEGEDDDEGQEEDTGEILVSDCEPGVLYLDSDGDDAEFIELNEDGKGIFEDADGDHILYEGDDYMTPKKKA